MDAWGQLLALRPFGSGRSALAGRTVDFEDRFAATYLDPPYATSCRPRALEPALAMTLVQ